MTLKFSSIGISAWLKLVGLNYTRCHPLTVYRAAAAAVTMGLPYACTTPLYRLFCTEEQASLKRFGDLSEGRFALVGVFIDVQPFVVDGVFHAAEKLK